MRLQRIRKSLLAAAWLVLLPLVTSTLLVLFAVPPTWRAPQSALLASLNAHSGLLFGGTFLLCSLLARYWLPPLAQSDKPRAAPARLFGMLLLTLGVCVALATALRARVVQLARVDSSSMLPTLQPEDVIVVNRFARGSAKRGEVVMFRHQHDGRNEDLVKRVVGLPGDLVDLRGGHVVINGWEAPSCDAGRYVHHSTSGWISGKLFVEFLGDQAYLTVHTPRVPRLQAPFKVAPGELFVLGDNRNSSNDSRVWNDGHGAGLPLAAVTGRVLRRLSRQHADGSLNLGRVLSRLDTALDLEGLDTSALEAGVRRCLASRPAVTLPPAP